MIELIIQESSAVFQIVKKKYEPITTRYCEGLVHCREYRIMVTGQVVRKNDLLIQI